MVETLSQLGNCYEDKFCPKDGVYKLENGDLSEPAKSLQLLISGYLENRKIRFLIDTRSEITVISRKVFISLPRQLRSQFESREHTLITANGAPKTAKGPLLCTLTIAGRSILEPVCAMEGGPPSILSMPALLAFGFHMTVAGVEVTSVPTRQAVRRLLTSHVLRVSLAENLELSPRTRKTILAQIDGNVSKGDWLMEPLGDNSSPLLVPDQSTDLIKTKQFRKS